MKLNQSLINSKSEPYFVINKKWMNEFIKYFEYDKFLQYFKIAEGDKIIKKYKEQNYSIIKENKINSQILQEIITILPESYFNFINEQLKNEEIIQKLSDLKIYSLEYEKKETSKGIILYYDNMEIINDNILNLISELFKIDHKDKRKFLFGDCKFIMTFQLPQQFSLIIGYLDENNSFSTELLLNFYMKEKVKYFMKKFPSKGYSIVMNNIKFNDLFEAPILTGNSIEEGNAYIIKNNQKENKILANQNKKEEKSELTSQDIQNNINEIRENSNFDKNNCLDNLENKSIMEKEDQQLKNIQTPTLIPKNIDNNISNENENQNTLIFGPNLPLANNNALINDNKNGQNDIVIPNDLQTPKKDINIELDSFTKAQIEILIMYYLFYEELKIKIRDNIKSNIDNFECYLINKDWMNYYKEFYLYNYLTQIIQHLIKNNTIQLNNNNKNIEEIIYNNLGNTFLKTIKEKDHLSPQNISENKQIIEEFFINKKNDMKSIYPLNFDILSINIYHKMIENKIINKDNLKKREYLINEKMIFIKCAYQLINEENKTNKNLYEIIGINLEENKNIFIPKLLFNYNDDKESMENNFNNLKSNSFNILFMNISKNKKHLINDNGNEHINIFYINKKDISIEKSKENNKNKIQNNKVFLDEKTISHIKFLFKLYFYYEDLNLKINQNQNNQNYEKGYMINRMLIENYKLFYNYNYLKDYLNKDDTLLLIKRNKESFEFISEEKIDKLLNELIRKIPEEYINYYKDKFIDEIKNTEYIKILNKFEKFIYFNNCMIVNENLWKMLLQFKEDDQILDLRIYYLIKNKQLYIIYNNFINIGILNDNIFKTEIIIYNDSNEIPELLINRIISNQYNIENIVMIGNKVGKFSNTNEDVLILNNNILDKINLYKKKIIGNNNSTNNLNKSLNKKKFNNATQIRHNNNLGHHILKKNSDNEKRRGNDQSFTIINSEQYTKLTNVISILIDLEKIKKKMSLPLTQNNNPYEYYYLLNYEWFKKYIKLNNLTRIFNYLLNNNIVQDIINKINSFNKKTITENIMSIINSDDLKNIKKDIIYYSQLKNENEFFPKIEKFKKNRYEKIKFYNNFLLLSQETIQLFNDEFYFNSDSNKFECILGDNRAIIIYQENSQNILGIYKMNRNDNISLIPEIFLKYYYKNTFNFNIRPLLEKGYKSYVVSHFMFSDNENDYTSPIFNENGNIIGYAFKYKPDIEDYTNYQINEQLISMIKLYFCYSYSMIKMKNLNIKTIKQEILYLINGKYIQELKNIYNYDNLINNLKQNKFASQIIELINTNKVKEQDIYNEKRIVLIIKNLPSEINKNYSDFLNNRISIDNISKNPDINNFASMNINYFDKFKLINQTIYDLLSKIDLQLNLNQRLQYVECLFVNKYILITIPQKISKANECIVEIGTLDENNIVNVSYLLMFGNEKDYKYYIIYINNIIGFETFLNDLKFNNGNSLQLYDQNDKEIGLIFNLKIGTQTQTQTQNKVINQNYSQKSNNNINNYNNMNYQNNIQNVNYNNSNSFNNIKSFNNVINNNINSNNYNNSNISPNNNNNNNGSNIGKPNIIINTIEKDFPSGPPLIGLQNVGATCYMNATLQCMCQIKKLVEYFKYNNSINEIVEKTSKSKQLTRAFKHLVENLWPSNQKYISTKNNHRNSSNNYYAPYHFKKTISSMDKLFEGAQANDSKDLVNFIIMTLHEELNKAPKKNLSEIINQQIDQTNPKIVLNAFLNSFINENQSIISDLFYAVSCTGTKCSVCNILKYNYQIYFFLIFPLEEVRKYKIQRLQNQYMIENQNFMNMNPMLYQQNLYNFQLNLQKNNSVNLDDCFEFNQKNDLFTGENAMYCNFCQKTLPSYYQTTLYTSPEILILVLNRGKGIEFKVKLEFIENLNLMNYVQLKDTGYMYTLIGVVTHMGESGASGHFIAYCKSPRDYNWYKYNDDLVSKVINFKQEIIDYAMPYILFYQKIK